MQLLRLYHTIRHLRWEQLWYRLYHRVKRLWYRPPATAPAPGTDLVTVSTACWRRQFDAATNTFSFLGLSHAFEGLPDWHFKGHGRLWTYQLNYWEWLENERIPVALRLQQMEHFSAHPGPSDSYPASLRLIHWVRFCLRHSIRSESVLRTLYRDAHRIAAFPEYHLLGNHLLENGLALWHVAYFFGDEALQHTASALLDRELKEQILPDGGHYERSIMYHAQLLLRLLHCLELPLQAASASLLRATAARMLGWMQAYCFAGGSFACIGDASPDETPPLSFLAGQAARLGILPAATTLAESGYRKYAGAGWEVLVNAGEPAPAYQPGHAHADTFTFCLQQNGRPLVADTGISTYERNARRLYERSTEAHNTLSPDGISSSDVWASFRMGRRASVCIEADDPGGLTAVHDGYRQLGVQHRRSFRCTARSLTITDDTGQQKKSLTWRLHFYPGVVLRQKEADQFEADGVVIRLKGLKDVYIGSYSFAAGYNRLLSSQCLNGNLTGAAEVVFEFPGPEAQQ